MRGLRICLVSSARLEPEYGAGLIARELAAALAARGHEVKAWWPGEGIRRRSPLGFHSAVRRAIEGALAEERSFDVVDVPALWLSRGVSHRGYAVARSVQPEILYAEIERLQRLPRTLLERAYWSLVGRLVLGAVRSGWERADRLLCLGSAEYRWMKRMLPAIAPRLAYYFAAPPEEERGQLAEIAATRGTNLGRAVRWLWIGRWVAHKGPGRLLDLLRQRLTTTEDSFTIAGCGRLPAEAIEESWNRSGRVRVVESFPRAELPALLSGHDAGLMTSEVEGWGISLQEMLESGMPVWATRTGAVPDLERHFPALLFPFPPPAGNLDQFAFQPDAGGGYAAEFSWGRIAERYEAVVLEDLARRGSR